MNEFDLKAKDWDENPEHVRRASAVADAIRAEAPLSPAMKTLEYGCGTGQLSFSLRGEVGEITAADSSAGMLDVLKQKIAAGHIDDMHPAMLDLMSDPLPQERFDLIATMMTLHHIPDTDAILRIFHQLLNDGGTLCIADLDKEDGSFHGAGFDGHNGFDRNELERQATGAGFRNVRFRTAFHMTKDTEQGEREFPVFLMAAEK